MDLGCISYVRLLHGTHLLRLSSVRLLTINGTTSTSIQLVYGRLSDVWFRKVEFLAGLAIFSAGSLAASFAQAAVRFIVFRALIGVNGGGLIGIGQMIVSGEQNNGLFSAKLGLIVFVHHKSLAEIIWSGKDYNERLLNALLETWSGEDTTPRHFLTFPGLAGSQSFTIHISGIHKADCPCQMGILYSRVSNGVQ